MYVQTQQPLCLRNSNFAGAGSNSMACKANKYAFLSFLTTSAGRAYMRNPSGLLAKNECKIQSKTKGLSVILADYLALDGPNHCLCKNPGEVSSHATCSSV